MLTDYVMLLKEESSKKFKAFVTQQPYESEEIKPSEEVRKYLFLIDELDEIRIIESFLTQKKEELKAALTLKEGEVWEKLKKRKELWERALCKAKVIDRLIESFGEEKEKLEKILFEKEKAEVNELQNFLLKALGYLIKEEGIEKIDVKIVLYQKNCLFMEKEDAENLTNLLNKFEELKIRIQILNAKRQVYKNAELEKEFENIQKEYLDTENKIKELTAKAIYKVGCC